MKNLRTSISEIDLHGHTVMHAHAIIMGMIANRGAKKAITVVTGKSGQIRREFPLWMEQHPDVREVEELNGGGAFRVRFKKAKK